MMYKHVTIIHQGQRSSIVSTAVQLMEETDVAPLTYHVLADTITDLLRLVLLLPKLFDSGFNCSFVLFRQHQKTVATRILLAVELVHLHNRIRNLLVVLLHFTNHL